MPTHTRLIDNEPAPNDPRPIKILCLGMCRTGTSSLLAILHQLGYTPTHMTKLIEDPRRKRLWIEAIECTFLDKSAQGRMIYGRTEFDILLGGYDVVLDVPYAIFAEHLIRAYPQAKVILTTRPVADWIQSMQSTVWQNVQWPSYRILRWIEPDFLGSFVELVDKIFLAHNGGRFGGPEAEQAYVLHNRRVQELVPEQQLLEVHPPFDLGRICNFLGKPTPSCTYPLVNVRKSYGQRMRIRRNRSIRLVVKRLQWVFLALVALVVLWGFWSRIKDGRCRAGGVHETVVF